MPSLDFTFDVVIAILATIAFVLMIGDIILLLNWRERAITLGFLIGAGILAAILS